MKKVIEFNPKYNLGDIVYGIFNNEVIKAKYLDDDYYEGVAKGLKEAHNIVNKVLCMQLEVKGGDSE